MDTPAENQNVVVAIDIGGTTMKGALFAVDGQSLDELSAATFKGSETPYSVLLRLIDSLIQSAGALNANLLAIGIGAPGLVNPDDGVVSYASNLKWRDLPLRDLVAERFGLPVIIDHDARTAARYGSRTTAGPEELHLHPYRNRDFRSPSLRWADLAGSRWSRRGIRPYDGQLRR
ncbi:ROK family protein [Arthrobacter sp. ISL-72]|uniref:ROK family protein n=1 Tax=Arthrobacter sp. ISL-72 TaxID=2819114 RepID=UPI001BE7BBF8|nr:ROK family protein [Arthrobacter sp. ISL-72]MBT2598103.1 ROK family protein [Arthrobacter sp. ISL-72]